MKKGIILLFGISFIFILFGVHSVLGQQTGCKVLIPALSGTYSGKCKNGFANGKGTAIGIDKYEGQFFKGVPQGKGTYTWSNGSWYNGQWSKGKRDGKGKMFYHLLGRDSIASGFWRNDKYVGERLIPPYTVIRNLGVIRYSFRKLNNTSNNMTVKFLIGGRINSDIEELSIATDSGEEYRSGSAIGIQSISFPLEVKITYRTWNQLHSSQSNVIFEFTINEPGNWEITIKN